MQGDRPCHRNGERAVMRIFRMRGLVVAGRCGTARHGTLLARNFCEDAPRIPGDAAMIATQALAL
jgi:hypothetical protein